MKALDVVAQLVAKLPEVTGLFNDQFVITSLTSVGTIATAETLIAHGLAVNQAAIITGSLLPLAINSLTRSGTVGTLVTDEVHDLTAGPQMLASGVTVLLSGSAESEFNGVFTLTGVPNRKTIEFTMVDAGATLATGSPTLEDGTSPFQGYNGVVQVESVPTTTSFTYTLPNNQSDLLPSTGSPTANTNIRVSSAISMERAIEAYTKQKDENLWAFVVVDDVVSSKNRSIRSDATDDQRRSQVGEDFRQQIIQPVSVFVFFPTRNQIAARFARDQAEDVFEFINQSILYKQFDSGLSIGDGLGALMFTTHGFAAYNTGYYVHGYSYEQVTDLRFEDSVGFDPDVAFRDIDLGLLIQLPNGDEQEMTAAINLDAVPVLELEDCALLTVPPTAPFDVDFGSPGGSGTTMAVVIPAGCTAISCEFDASSGGDALGISVWTGSASDTGQRFNIFYWDGDDRIAGGSATGQFINVDPTGLTDNDGFFDGENVVGNGGSIPNLVVISGFDSKDAQTLNVKIAVIGD